MSYWAFLASSLLLVYGDIFRRSVGGNLVAIPETALSCKVAVTAAQRILFYVDLSPIEVGTNVVVSVADGLDPNEMAHMWLDLSAMVLESILDPDSTLWAGKHVDVSANKKEYSDNTPEIPF
jgi:hypothetical protein